MFPQSLRSNYLLIHRVKQSANADALADFLLIQVCSYPTNK